MKNFKRVLSVLLVLTMLIPMGMFSANAANGLYSGDNWNGLACKFSGTTNSIIAPKKSGTPVIKTDGFTMTDTADGGISVVTPDYKTFNGVYSTSAITSTNKTDLDGLTVVVKPDAWSNDLDTINAANTISVIWSEDPIETVYDFDTGVGLSNSIDASSNGLRHLIPTVPGVIEGNRASSSAAKEVGEYTGKALCISVTNAYSEYEDTMYASTVSIVYYDGYYVNTQDHHPGYRWVFTARNVEGMTSNADKSGIITTFEQIDLTYGLTVSVKADDTLGYIVNVNGKDYYKGSEVGYFPDAEYKTKKVGGIKVEDPECYGLGNSINMLTETDYEQKTDKYKSSLEYQKKDINLNGLKEVTDGGYLTVGAVSNNDKTTANHNCNYTVEKINAIDAKDWQGENMDPEHVHNLTVQHVEAPKCGVDGAIVRRCACGKVETEVIKKLSHSYIIDNTKTYEATCAAKGHEYKVCSICGDVVDEDIDQLTHIYDDWYITEVATTAKQGTKEAVCTLCGDVKSTKYSYSSTDDYANNWEITAQNGYSVTYKGNLVSATKNGDNSLTLADTSKMLNNTTSYAAITKAIAKNKASLNGFTATVTPEALNSTTEVYPETLAFLFTNDYDKYNTAGEYSTGAKTKNFPGVAAENKLRYGHLWNPEYETGEYALSIVLMDSVTIDASHTTYGTPGDGKYDVVYWANIANGNYWKDNYQVLDTPVDMGDEIFFEMYYEPEDVGVAPNIYIGINSVEEINFFCLTGQQGSQLRSPDYYFAVAAYSPNKGDGKSASSFTINDVCGVNPADYTGYVSCTNMTYSGQHDLQPVAAKASTCLEGGTIAYYECSECKARFSDAAGAQAITDISDGTSPKGHSKTYSDWTTSVEAKCTTPGEEVQKCLDCDAVMNTRSTPATKHNETGKWKTKVDSTTCTMPGYKELKCKTCDERIKVMTYSAAHTLDHVEAVEETYSHAGNIEYYKCTVCKKLFTDAEGTKETTADKVVIPAKTFPYKDVKTNDWFYKSVIYCVEKGLFKGTSATTFSPNVKLTREQFMMVLFNFEGADESEYQGATGFTDVPAGQWYSAAVKWAKDEGITSGLGGGKFGLGVEISREQFATLLMNYASSKGKSTTKRANIDSYTDKGQVSSWALDGIKWAVAEKLMSGTTATTLSPKNIADRATATMLFMNFDQYFNTPE